MSPDVVTVTADRTGTDELTASAAAVEAEGPLEVHLESTGGPAHVHGRLAGDLANVATLEAFGSDDGDGADGNYYVAPDEPRKLLVDLEPTTLTRPIEGTLVLATGYGAVETTIDIRLVPGPRPVDVDKQLGEPARQDSEQPALEAGLERVSAVTRLDSGTLGVAVLALLAVVLAWSTAAVIGGTAAYVGAGIVAIGVVVALALLSGALE
ncbi:DUF7524 family protein [Natronosalvus vescus]|uniref:DUF7524 family protein n=1 Tax=Natronosalvus vescus TaxID=2953881 RepID=UPI0020902A7B|nr:hypothetical protein [Natronosalvus vescus]